MFEDILAGLGEYFPSLLQSGALANEASQAGNSFGVLASDAGSGAFGSPGYGVLQSSGDANWLGDFNIPNGDPYGIFRSDINPGGYGGVDWGIPGGSGPDTAKWPSQGGGMMDIMKMLGGQMQGMGRGMQGMQPSLASGLSGLGQLMHDILQRNAMLSQAAISKQAPAANTNAGVTRPLALAGSGGAVKVSPLEKFAELVRSLA